MSSRDTTIVLPPRLAEPLSREAERKGVGIDELINSLITRYLDRMEPDKLGNEVEAFRAMHDSLLGRYQGQYVALHDGRVVDSDADRRDLYLRMRSRFGSTPVLIRKVSETVEREFVVLSPHLERGRP